MNSTLAKIEVSPRATRPEFQAKKQVTDQVAQAYRTNKRRDMVREIIEENILPDLLDAADRLAALNMEAKVLLGTAEGEAHVASVRIELDSRTSRRPLALTFSGNVSAGEWKVSAFAEGFELPASGARQFGGGMGQVTDFTRNNVAALFQAALARRNSARQMESVSSAA